MIFILTRNAIDVSGGYMRFNPEIHHRHSIRLPGFNYSDDGAYFLTFCVNEREGVFSEINQGQSVLNEIGRMATTIWKNLPRRFPFVHIDEFVVMPNHIHGILWVHNAPHSYVGAIHELPLRLGDEQRIARRRMALSRVIGYFKMNVAKRGNRMRNAPGNRFWQRNYYERVIRDEAELDRIREYIIKNPTEWERDPENIK